MRAVQAPAVQGAIVRARCAESDLPTSGVGLGQAVDATPPRSIALRVVTRDGAGRAASLIDGLLFPPRWLCTPFLALPWPASTPSRRPPDGRVSVSLVLSRNMA